MAVRYLTPAEVVALHQYVMRRMGWRPAPLRSEDLLESAVQRAQAAVDYGGADHVEQACVLSVGLSQNQPFLDGNKRTAYAAFKVFLFINGMRLAAEPMETAQQLIAVAERDGSLEEATQRFAAWVRERAVRNDKD